MGNILILLAAAATAFSPRVAALAVPDDVKAFIERRLECEHWMGEEPYDKARAREINKAIGDLKCANLAKDEAKLRVRHAGSEAVQDALTESADWPL